MDPQYILEQNRHVAKLLGYTLVYMVFGTIDIHNSRPTPTLGLFNMARSQLALV